MLFLPVLALAGNGDTMTVRSHDRVHMNWNGNYDRKAYFPTQGKSYQRVKMHYTLGCPDKGCSEWDYTAQVFLRQPTGGMDSTLKTAPNFKVDGTTPDSFYYNEDTVYTYFYNATLPGIDSTANQPVMLILFGDSLNPTTATDTLEVWDAWAFRPEYDMNGDVVDSVQVGYTAKLIRNDHEWYQVFEVINNLELGRLITPYAADRTKEWSFTYTFDITEFALLLKDSVDIRAHYSGYQDGFTVTLDFEFIEGQPALRCTDILPIYQGSFPYGEPKGIEEYLTEKKVNISKGQNTRARLRVIQTGHGLGGNENCAEFCAKDHYVFVNGEKRYTTLVWKDNCGSNAIYPQPGTWLYDRSNWCPGEAVRSYDYWVDEWLTDGENSINLDMQPFTDINNNNNSYIISAYLMVYEEDPMAAADVSLDAIIAPNTKSNFVRFNPTCGRPRVRVKNTSMKKVESIRFRYGVGNGAQADYTWTGTIEPYESKDIDLAFFDWTGASSKTFSVKIDEVNGAADGFSANNELSSEFELTPQFPEDFQIWFKANNKGSETTLSVHDLEGGVIWSRSNFSNGESVKDTVRLIDGCYYFKVTDSQRNGFKFWAIPDGTGSLTLRQINGQLIQVVDGDFGTDYIQYFTVGHPLSADNPDRSFELKLYPNPAGEQVTLQFESRGSNMLELMDVQGRVLIRKTFDAEGQVQHRLNTSELSAGVYLIRLQSGGAQVTRRLIIE